MVQMHFCDCIRCWFGHSNQKEILEMNGQNKWCEIVIQLEKTPETNGKCAMPKNSTNKGIYYGFKNYPSDSDFMERPKHEFSFFCHDDECNTEDLVKFHVWKIIDKPNGAHKDVAKCIEEAFQFPEDENITCFNGSPSESTLKSISRRKQLCEIKFFWNETNQTIMKDGGEFRFTMNGTVPTTIGQIAEGCESEVIDEVTVVSCYCRTSECNNKYNLKNLLNKEFTKNKMNSPEELDIIDAALLEFSQLIEPTTTTSTSTTTMTTTGYQPAPSQSQHNSTDCQTCQCVNNASSANSAMSAAQTAPLNSQSSQKENSESSDTTSHIVIYCLAALSFIGFLGLCAMAWMIMKLRKELNAGLITASSMGSVPRSVGTETPKTSRTSVLSQ